MRLIDADALKQTVGSYNPVKYTYEYGYVITVEDIDSAPTVDAVEREHGVWLRGSDIYGNKFMNCSQCHTDTDIPEMYDWEDVREMYHFCPFCGADMREEDNE